MLYDSCKIESINYQIYLNWFDAFSNEFPVDKIIYVKTDSNICHERIMKRSRTGENNIPLDYLESCYIYHEDMIRNLIIQNICKEQMVLDGNVDIFNNNNQLDTWIKEIGNFINK
jgi:deoxyadenosine/deoxycytidine kinase